MDYKHFSVNDFASDEKFRRWVKQPEQSDLEFWKQWLARHPEKQEIIEEAKLLVKILGFEQNQPNNAAVEEVKKNIKAHIQSGGSAHVPVKTLKPASTFASWQRVAAVFIGVTMMGLLYYFLADNYNNTFYATNFGEIKTIPLPDGSMATLNGNSSLRLSSDWEAGREVWLEGEAFFEVKKVTDKSPQNQAGKKKKFTVHTRHLDVEVLGTTFNVNERRGITKVALNTGRVQLIKQSPEDTTTISMTPGELVEYEEANKNFRKQLVNTNMVSVWKEGKFAFEGTSLQEIGRMLEDSYGYSVTIEGNGLAERKFTANLPSRNVDFLLSLIAELMDIKAERNGDEITLEPKSNQ